jgi:hypothetical protein
MVERYVGGGVTEQHGEREDALAPVFDFQPAQLQFRSANPHPFAPASTHAS